MSISLCSEILENQNDNHLRKCFKSPKKGGRGSNKCLKSQPNTFKRTFISKAEGNREQGFKHKAKFWI
jgi:hypothetical protein